MIYVLAAFWLNASAALPAQTYTTLLQFDNADGLGPNGPLIQATDGNLYGTTVGGGTNGFGTAFKITLDGKLTTLYSFCSLAGCADGEEPTSGLIQGIDGNFYGTTSAGGVSGLGTVFKLTASDKLTTLHSFDSTDGATPNGALVQVASGGFYGTTSSGGAKGSGTVFAITPNGTLTTLYNFCSKTGCKDGGVPSPGLVQASNGNLYGATSSGGSDSCTDGCGTIFRMTLQGVLTTLHSFDSTDGATPNGALVQSTNGNFYGTTAGGGTNGSGTVFGITPAGTLTTLYNFCSQTSCIDGSRPNSLIQATDGNFYATTQGGGNEGYGTVFEISPVGTLTTLVQLNGLLGAATPDNPLVQANNGDFYGTTYFFLGTIFEVSGPLAIVSGLENSVSLQVFDAADSKVGQKGDSCTVQDCFTIQQNFFPVNASNQPLYWVQSVVNVSDTAGVNLATPDVQIWSADRTSKIISLSFAPAFVSLPADLSFVSSLSEGTLTLATYYGQIPLSSVSFTSKDLPLLTAESSIGWTLNPSNFLWPPEFVLVGGGDGSTADFCPAKCSSPSTTVGNISSHLTLSDGSVPDIMELAVGGDEPQSTVTAEKSQYLVWSGLGAAWIKGSSAPFQSEPTGIYAAGIWLIPSQ
jgi:uncharacterized repeat protein (TIGR03803 family)